MDLETVLKFAQTLFAVLLALGLREMAAAWLRRSGDNAVEEAAETPSKDDDRRAAMYRDVVHAAANALERGDVTAARTLLRKATTGGA